MDTDDTQPVDVMQLPEPPAGAVDGFIAEVDTSEAMRESFQRSHPRCSEPVASEKAEDTKHVENPGEYTPSAEASFFGVSRRG